SLRFSGLHDGVVALPDGAARLHEQRDRRRNEEKDDDCSQCRRRAVPRDKLAKLVERGGWPSQNGLAGHVSANVFSQCRGAGISPLRILVEALQNYCVQLAGDGAGDRAGPARWLLANTAYRLGEWRLVNLVRQSIGQELVKDYAERIDIAADIDAIGGAAGLL